MKRGFTLIELLAVIVILAIIAVIATPIVLNIIKDAKKSTTERSIENYVESINLAISKSQMSNSEYSNGCHNIKEFDIETSGKIPESGYVCIRKGKLASYNLILDKKQYQKQIIKQELDMDYFNNSESFGIYGASFFYDNTMGLKYYVKKEVLDNYDEFYITIDYTSRQLPDEKLKIEIRDYEEDNGYYMFKDDSSYFAEFANDKTITLTAKKGNDKKEISIKYNIQKYAQNILLNTTNEKTKNIIKAFLNYATANQYSFGFNTTNFANTILESSDQKIDEFTDKGSKLYESLDSVDDTIQNNPDPYLINNNIGIVTGTPLNIKNNISITMSIKLPSNISENEKYKYGVLFFTNDSYEKEVLKNLNYDSLDINSKYLIFDINMKDSPDDTALFGQAYKAYLKINFSDLNVMYLARSYYKVNDKYYYDKVYKDGILLHLKSTVNSTNKNSKNVAISLFNLAAELE